MSFTSNSSCRGGFVLSDRGIIGSVVRILRPSIISAGLKPVAVTGVERYDRRAKNGSYWRRILLCVARDAQVCNSLSSIHAVAPSGMSDNAYNVPQSLLFLS